MRRFFTVLISLSLTCMAFAQMSDQALIKYIQKGAADGKNQNQIAKELMAKGVTMDQMQRVLKLYQESGLDEKVGVSDNMTFPSGSRLRFDGTADSRKETELGEDIPMPPKDSLNVGHGMLWYGRMLPIYGHNLFDNKNLTFEPNVNAPTPSDYIIGAGDEVIIDVWGENEANIKEEVSPDGNIYIEQIGPVRLSGMSISQATSTLRQILSQKYSLSGEEPGSRMSVTLGNIRSIQVNVVGEVNMPGTYRVSSLSSVYNVLYSAGGVTPIGSLRTVRVSRGGKVVATADLYDYIINGGNSGDLTLKDGDAVIVPPYNSLVEAGRGFKRPMLYEILPGESVGQVIRYAGGFVSNASAADVAVTRQDGGSGRVFSVAESDFHSFPLSGGDIIDGYLNETDTYANRVEIRGSVLHPGIYALGDEIATVRQLVTRAGGPLEDAFLSRAQLIREKADRSLEVTAVPLGAIMDGSVSDVLLRRSDILLVSNTNELNPKGTITINGYIFNPGDYEYAEGMSIEDLIMLAGGLMDGASSVNVEVARRIYSTDATEASDSLAQIFTCRIEDGLMVDGAPSFTLDPYDVVTVRKDPRYQKQRMVTVSGEAVFPGAYVLVSNNEHLSDIYRRAGGATPNGYIQGAMIKRRMSRDDENMKKSLINAAKNTVDSLDLKEMKEESVMATLGINLDRAIAEPGGLYDVILRDGDELIIPQSTNTVGVQGEVLFPNMVSYVEGKTLKYYISKAGGYSSEAKRSKTFVVYMNGEADMGGRAVIRPGCQVFVPAKSKDKLSVGEWMSISTTAASLATMVATIVNLIKK